MELPVVSDAVVAASVLLVCVSGCTPDRAEPDYLEGRGLKHIRTARFEKSPVITTTVLANLVKRLPRAAQSAA